MRFQKDPDTCGRGLIAMGLKIFCICSKSVLNLLRKVKRPLRTVLCEESPYHLINVSSPFSDILQP